MEYFKVQKLKFVTLLPIGAFLVGCGSSDDDKDQRDDLPELANVFQPIPDYAFDDFQLDSNVLYWEIRAGNRDPRAGGTTEAVWRYDTDRYQALTDEQQAQLDATESTGRLQDSCMTEYCVNYGAAITEDGVEVLHDEPGLLAFFGRIDSEAELNFWLWANEYNGLTYEVVDAGYTAIAFWSDPLCAEDVYYRLYVDANGAISETEEVLRREPTVCP